MRASTPYADAGAQSPEALIEQHAPLVKRIAAHMLGRLPKTPLANMLVSIANGMGVPTEQFADSTGALTGLT